MQCLLGRPYYAERGATGVSKHDQTLAQRWGHVTMTEAAKNQLVEAPTHSSISKQVQEI